MTNEEAAERLKPDDTVWVRATVKKVLTGLDIGTLVQCETDDEDPERFNVTADAVSLTGGED